MVVQQLQFLRLGYIVELAEVLDYLKGITSNEEAKLKQDVDYEIFDKLRKANTNSVYVIESLVDIFFDYVYSMESRNQQYLPYIIDLSKRRSKRY